MPSLRQLAASSMVLALGLLGSTPAQAFPWDIDMVDAQFFKAYEWAMMNLPDGAVTMNRYHENGDRMTPEGQAMVDPYGEPTPKDLASGKRMFDVYCVTCHGPDGKGGSPVTFNDPANNIRRFPIPPPMLSGDGAITALRSDGYIYLTIRNGGAIMPKYGPSMDDREIWDTVAYIRTLPGAQYVAPPQPTENK